MRHTVVIDDDLLEEAQEALGTKGVRETVETGLREAVRRQRLARLRNLIGTMDLDLTLEDVHRMREFE